MVKGGDRNCVLQLPVYESLIADHRGAILTRLRARSPTKVGILLLVALLSYGVVAIPRSSLFLVQVVDKTFHVGRPLHCTYESYECRSFFMTLYYLATTERRSGGGVVARRFRYRTVNFPTVSPPNLSLFYQMLSTQCVVDRCRPGTQPKTFLKYFYPPMMRRWRWCVCQR